MAWFIKPIFDLAQIRDVPIMVHPGTVLEEWTTTLRLDNIFLKTGFGFALNLLGRSAEFSS